jgi:dTDP-4-dehydrorhamnose reductase
MLKFADSRDELSVIFDQIGTPTYAAHLASTIFKIINNTDVLQKSGTYHFSNEGVASWYDFAQAIFALKNKDINLSPIETKDYPTPAVRPHYSVLNKAKIKLDFDIEIAHWREALEECLKKF